MPIKIKTDLDFGQIFYLKSDPDQFEHRLVGVEFLPGNAVRFRLSCMGEECQVYDFEASSVIDQAKVDKSKDDEADDSD